MATAAIAPDLKPPQYMKALNRANIVRFSRADIKHQVAVGTLDVRQILMAPPGSMLTATVSELLMSQWRWGKIRTQKFLGILPVSFSKTIGGCSMHQREMIASRLGPPRSRSVVAKADQVTQPSPTAPSRSPQQRFDALALANHVRVARAKLKQDVKRGEVSALVILLDPPRYCDTMKVKDLIMAIHKVGKVKCNKILTECRISPVKTLDGLNDRQRRELVAALQR